MLLGLAFWGCGFGLDGVDEVTAGCRIVREAFKPKPYTP